MQLLAASIKYCTYLCSFFGKVFHSTDNIFQGGLWPLDYLTLWSSHTLLRHKRQVCQQLFVAIGATTRVEGAMTCQAEMRQNIIQGDTLKLLVTAVTQFDIRCRSEWYHCGVQQA